MRNKKFPVVVSQSSRSPLESVVASNFTPAENAIDSTHNLLPPSMTCCHFSTSQTCKKSYLGYKASRCPLHENITVHHSNFCVWGFSKGLFWLHRRRGCRGPGRRKQLREVPYQRCPLSEFYHRPGHSAAAFMSLFPRTKRCLQSLMLAMFLRERNTLCGNHRAKPFRYEIPLEHHR